MNRLLTLILIGLAGFLASCGSSVTSSTKPGAKDVYTVVVSPDRLTLNAGDWTSITATVDLSNQNQTPKAVTPQPTIKFFSSDPRVTVSPAGEVCAGQWDTRYLTCSQTTVPNTNPPQLDIPTGQVTVTAYNASHNVSGSTVVTVHPRAASITLSSTDWGTRTCISQNAQVKYLAAPVDANGKAIGVFADNDYTWTVGDPNVASVSSYGFVIARNPGVTNVYAKLNGTVSVPLAFATCPPKSIELASSAFTRNVPVAPFSTADLTLNKGDQKYLTATLLDSNGNATPLVDTNGNPLNTLPLSYITSDLLTGSFTSVLPLTSKLTTNTSGRFTVMAACEPDTCNASVADFNSPAGRTTGKAAGFGYPIYSNVIGVTVQGTTGSTVLVTGTTFADGTTPVHRLLTYDSESMAVTQRIALANLPNSMVIAPDGLKAYLGSSDGLMVVNLTSFQSSIQNYPVAGGLSTDVVTGKVLGVSPDSRYILISDTTNGLVFYIDTTGTKVAARYTIPGIQAVAFASDSSNTWIAGDAGVYVFNSDTFVPTLTNASTLVKALAWTPDGQSYFASGSQLINYSTCDDRINPQALTGSPFSLSTTALGGVPHVIGLSGTQWLDYSVTTTAQVGNPAPAGDVCLSTVTVNTPATATSTLSCAAQQTSFSPTLEKEFVTGVDPACTSAEALIHGYDATAQKEITLSTTNPIIPLSGGVLNDGRKLFFGTYDSTAKTAALHRIDLATGTEDSFTDPTSNLVTIPASVELVPSFVAVVPK
jgi:hypothetical protein